VRNFFPRTSRAERSFAIWAALRAAQMAKLSRCRTDPDKVLLLTTLTMFAPQTPTYDLLLVDDNLDNLNVLAGMLQEQNYKMRRAINGAIALRATAARHPNLILLDVNLPDMNGYEICTQLKADPATSQIPIIFVSALNESWDKVRAFEVGGVDYITKPFEMGEVLVRVKNHLRIQAAQDQISQMNATLEARVQERTLQLEIAKAEILAALEKEQQLGELKSRLVQIVSHEFRTPLATILSSVDLVQHYGDRISADETQQQFQQIRSAIDRLTELLNDVMTFNQSETNQIPFNPQPMDLLAFCQTLSTGINRTSHPPDRLQFEVILAEGVSADRPLKLDAKLLRYILDNLLSNALKYSPAESPVILTLTLQAEKIIFQVSDRGIGISAEDKPYIFDAFFRANNVGNIKGTGLGLSLVQRFVEYHGGHIHLFSTLGQGTEIQVTFPVVCT
jgi:signal transduction histidine kinase